MDEADYLPLSALSQYLWCSRRCALIHIEQVWLENLFTAEGRVMHNKVHEENIEMRNDVRIERGIPLRSNEMGLNGKADVIEFHRDEQSCWIPLPVEFKRGKPKIDDCDKVQLCAQALCLEEMLSVSIPKGAIFYGKIRRRFDVEFDEDLRKETKDTATCLHEFIKQGKTPKPVYSKKCESCSLISVCMPKIVGRNSSVDSYLKRETKES